MRVVGASLCASLTRLVLNSVWLYIMYGKGLFGMLPARFTETICMVAAQILLIPVLLYGFLLVYKLTSHDQDSDDER